MSGKLHRMTELQTTRGTGYFGVSIDSSEIQARALYEPRKRIIYIKKIWIKPIPDTFVRTHLVLGLSAT